MRKVLSILLALSFILLLAACDRGETEFSRLGLETAGSDFADSEMISTDNSFIVNGVGETSKTPAAEDVSDAESSELKSTTTTGDKTTETTRKKTSTTQKTMMTMGLFDPDNDVDFVKIPSDYDPTAPQLHPRGTIPQGATYKRTNGTELEAGDAFPVEINHLDSYTYGDYTYKYYAEKGGWDCQVIDTSKTEYAQILVSINDTKVVRLNKTFADCKSLKTPPVIPQGVTELCCTFQGCSSLKKAPLIPSTVIDMSSAFYGCSALQKAPPIPEGVKNMYCAFYGCSSLKKAPQIPNTVTNLSHTFYECITLEMAPELPGSVESLDNTFYRCYLLKSYAGAASGTPEGDFSGYVIPDGVTVMSYTFSYCSLLTAAPLIPDAVTTMRGTFGSCTSLEILPDGFKFPGAVTDIKCAFTYCYKIKEVPPVPSSVKDMKEAFQYCRELRGIVEVNADPTIYDNCFNGTNKNIKITGSCSYETKKNLALTSKGGNVTTG